MLNNKKVLLAISVFMVLAVSNVFCGTASTGWWIFRRPQSAKPVSLTTVVGVRGDLSGVFYNPSVLGELTQKEIYMMSELGVADDTFGGLMYGHPIGKKAGLSVGVVYYDAGKTRLFYMENGQEKERNVTVQKDMLGLLSYGQKINDKLSGGLTLKFANSNIAEVKSASAFGCDLGGMYLLPVKGMSASLALQNIGGSSKFIDKKDSLPATLWFGCGYGLNLMKNSSLGLGLEFPYIIDEKRVSTSLGLGLSYDIFSANLGYRFALDDAALQVGFGLVLKDSIEITYSFTPAKYLQDTHRFTVGYRFGAMAKKK